MGRRETASEAMLARRARNGSLIKMVCAPSQASTSATDEIANLCPADKVHDATHVRPGQGTFLAELGASHAGRRAAALLGLPECCLEALERARRGPCDSSVCMEIATSRLV